MKSDELIDIAKKQTKDTLQDFFSKVLDKEFDWADTEDGYNYSANAVAAMAVAAAYVAANHYGITGFQAGWVNLQFLSGFGHYKPPFVITDLKNLLYPQYEDTFTTITKDTWEWLQKEAKKRLEEGDATGKVRDHWESIAEGKIPFGMGLRDF